MTGYYEGILAFKRFYREVDLGYDWADLSDAERKKWAEIEREQNE